MSHKEKENFESVKQEDTAIKQMMSLMFSIRRYYLHQKESKGFEA